MVEKRKSVRRVLRTPVSVIMATGQTFAARSYDLAEGGMAVVSAVQLPAACGCHLRFELMIRGQLIRLDVPAQLIYSLPCAEGFKNGLQFVDPGPEVAVALRQYCALAG